MVDASIVHIGHGTERLPPRPERADWLAEPGLPFALLPVLASALDACVVIDQRGCITGWNEIATGLFGWTASEAIGNRMSSMIIPYRLREAHERGILRAMAKPSAVMTTRWTELDALHRDGHEFPVEIAMASGVDCASRYFIAFMRDLTDRRALAVQSMRQSRTMTARLQKMFSQIQSIALLNSRRNGSDAAEKLAARMLAMSTAHGLLADNDWQDAELASLLRRLLLGPITTGRARLSGLAQMLTADQLLGVASVVQELQDNACRHGAFATAGGHVDLSWREEAGEFCLQWLETGLTGQTTPLHSGVGQEIIETVVRHDLRGDVRRYWRSTGLCLEIRFPVGGG